MKLSCMQLRNSEWREHLQHFLKGHSSHGNSSEITSYLTLSALGKWLRIATYITIYYFNLHICPCVCHTLPFSSQSLAPGAITNHYYS